MSGFPNLAEISELRAELEIVKDQDEDIAQLKTKIYDAQFALQSATEKRRDAMQAIERLLNSMDCQQPGNNGYENRRIALLKGLSQVAEQYGRTHR